MMPFRFAHPEWLWLLVLIPLAARMARGSLAGLTRVRWWGAVTLRSLVLAVLVLALARLEWRMSVDETCVIFALDWSDSIPASPDTVRAEARRFVSASTATRSDGDRAGIVYFGRDAAIERPPTAEEVPVGVRQTVFATDATDIAAALRLSAATFPASSRRRIVLLTDGNENRGSALSEVDALRVRGITLDILPLRYLHENEIALDSLSLPERIAPNTPFRVRAVIRSGRAATVRLQLTRDDAVKGIATTELRPGRNAVVFTVPGERGTEEDFLKGLITYRLEVQPLEAGDEPIDTNPVNNVGYAFTSMDGPPQVLYLDGNTVEADYTVSPLLAALRAAYAGSDRTKELSGVIFDYRPLHARDFPAPDLLARYDAIIIDNLPADDLGPERMRRIRTLVQDFGTGLVMIGGQNSFGAGNYRQTPVEEALPVEMDLKNRKVLPNGALMLVIDCSGSMEGDKLVQAKLAAREAARALSPYDYIGIIAFDAEPTWILKPVLANNQAKIRRQIDQIGPAGGTDIVKALAEGYRGIAGLNASFRHIVLLSDGQAPEEGLAPLMAKIALGGITVSTVGIGEAEGQKMMETIATLGSGRYHLVKDPKQLPRIFVRESLMVKRGLIHDTRVEPEVVATPPFLAGLLRAPLRPLLGYVATTPRPQATVSLVCPGEERDPILAHWRFGLGTAVAFTSDTKERWGVEWVGWDRFSALWAAILQETIRKDTPGRLALTTEYRDGAARCIVEATDESGTPESGLALVLSVRGADEEATTVALKETGIGRYEAAVGAELSGRHLVSVSGTNAAGQRRAAVGGFVVPSQAEFEKLEPDLAFLHELARRGGGRILSGNAREDAVFRRNLAPVEDFRELWRTLLAVAGCLFFADVFFRRVQLPYEAVGAWVAARMPAWVPGPRQARRARPQPSAVTDTAPDSGISGIPGGPEATERLFAAEAADMPEEGDPEARQAAPAPPENVFTSRLLSAKKRARDAMK